MNYAQVSFTQGFPWIRYAYVLEKGKSFSNRRGWQYLEDKAASRQRDDRHLALVRAYAWLEHALRALGYTRAQGRTAELVKEAHRQGLFKLPSYLGYGNAFELINRSIKIRHIATHVDTVPGSSECKTAVRVFGDIWRGLRKHFVTLDRAQAVARVLLNIRHIQSIALYGSLARNAPEPGDIDLLLFDDGFYSEAIAKGGETADDDEEDLEDDLELDVDPGEYEEPGVRTKLILQKLGITDGSRQQAFFDAACCRWLDVLLLDGSRFGADVAYTLETKTRQSDAFFSTIFR